MGNFFRKHSIVLLDASTLLDVSKTTDQMMRFWKTLLSRRDASEDVKIIVSDGVLKELVRHQQDRKKDAEIQQASQRVLNKIKELQDAEEIFVVKDHISDHTDTVRLHADRFFINTINNYKTARNIYVITQDVNLMKDIYQAAGMESLSGHGAKGVYVCKVPRNKSGVINPSSIIHFKDKGDIEDKNDGRRLQEPIAESGLPSFRIKKA